MALPVSNTFEGGVDGNTLTTANTGGASGTAISSIVTGAGVTQTFSTLVTRDVISYNVVQPTTGITSYVLWSGWGTLTADTWARMYINVNKVSVANIFWHWRTAADAACAYLGLTTAGKIQAYNAAGAAQAASLSTTVLAINTWYRIEARLVPSTTVGQIEWWLYSGADLDTNTATETKSITSQVLAANVGGCRVGYGVTSSFTFNGGRGYIDDVAFSSTAKIGPSGAPAAPTTRPVIWLPHTALHRTATR